MSNAQFPTFPGLTWDVVLVPEWNTVISEAASGRETRSARRQYPNWKITAAIELLRDVPVTSSEAVATELMTLLGFYNARQGMFDSFLLRLADLTQNDDHSACTGQNIGTGDGTTTDFQLVKDWGSFQDIVQNPNGTPVVYVDGVATTAFTLLNSYPNYGVIRMNVAPTAGQKITADFLLNWRVRFDDDAMEFNAFQYQLWEARTVSLKVVKL